jgi:hypothetical protein
VFVVFISSQQRRAGRTLVPRHVQHRPNLGPSRQDHANSGTHLPRSAQPCGWQNMGNREKVSPSRACHGSVLQQTHISAADSRCCGCATVAACLARERACVIAKLDTSVPASRSPQSLLHYTSPPQKHRQHCSARPQYRSSASSSTFA